ncbi:MAG: 30S ribosomal protein S9 [Myxococcales bacterium]|nr:30S ribosomal protein S9 [Myxococcales bacterium]
MAKSNPIHGRYYGTGKRKTAVARVFLREGQGTMIVNGRPLAEYFPREVLCMIIEQPFEAIDKRGAFDVEVNVAGGGVAAQAEAVRHGISRALVALDQDLKPTLKKHGFMTRDSRKKERKKPGQPGARKKFQYSKR